MEKTTMRKHVSYQLVGLKQPGTNSPQANPAGKPSQTCAASDIQTGFIKNQLGYKNNRIDDD